MRFLNSLDIPLITTLRDTQNYVRSAEAGVGVYEMPRWQVQQDFEHWRQLLGWLADRRRSQRTTGAARNGVEINGASIGGAAVAETSLDGAVLGEDSVEGVRVSEAASLDAVAVSEAP
jgi:hypothetical protein